MKFENKVSYLSNFNKLPNARFYPYVCKEYDTTAKKILIYGNNSSCGPDIFDVEEKRTASKTHNGMQWRNLFINKVGGLQHSENLLKVV